VGSKSSSRSSNGTTAERAKAAPRTGYFIGDGVVFNVGRRLRWALAWKCGVIALLTLTLERGKNNS